VTLGEWVHIAAVYDADSDEKYIYINGVEDVVENTNAGARISPVVHNVYIGARADSGNTGSETHFSGLLDEVRIYDKALTPADIALLGGANVATGPTPKDGATAAPTASKDGATAAPTASGASLYMVLNYTPGDGATKHTGYFGDNYDDVSNRLAGTNLGEPPYSPSVPTQYYVGLDDDAIPELQSMELYRYAQEGMEPQPG